MGCSVKHCGDRWNMGHTKRRLAMTEDEKRSWEGFLFSIITERRPLEDAIVSFDGLLLFACAVVPSSLNGPIRPNVHSFTPSLVFGWCYTVIERWRHWIVIIIWRGRLRPADGERHRRNSFDSPCTATGRGFPFFFVLSYLQSGSWLGLGGGGRTKGITRSSAWTIAGRMRGK